MAAVAAYTVALLAGLVFFPALCVPFFCGIPASAVVILYGAVLREKKGRPAPDPQGNDGPAKGS